MGAMADATETIALILRPSCEVRTVTVSEIRMASHGIGDTAHVTLVCGERLEVLNIDDVMEAMMRDMEL
jgi:hypothetical protein